MLWNRFAFVFLAAACIAAAAGGGYLASRQNATTTPVAAASQAPAPSVSSAPVQETEAIIGDKANSAAKTSAGPGTAAPTSGSAKRSPTAIDVEKEPPARAPARVTTAAAADVNARQDAPQVPAANGPSPATSAPPTFPQGQDANAAQTPRVDERGAVEPPRALEPPAKVFDELVISPDSVIGLQTENTVTSETARLEDRVDAHVTRDVRVGDRIAIPAGARVIGSVTLVDRGGKFKERARLGIRFHTVVLADGTRVPISTETITRDGEAPTSAAKVGGGAVTGAIIGAILGGAKGAAIGGATGAGAGAAAVASGDRNTARLPAGTQATVRILSPVTVTVEK